MLRTNLASRPFYNERGVRVLLVAIAALALALAVFTIGQFATLRTRGRALEAQAAAAERRAQELRAEAVKIRQSIRREDLETVQAAAREANRLIDGRAFSWTALFNRFESTLPADVRITAVQPQIAQDGRMVIAITALARQMPDLDAFIERLEQTGAFASTLSREEQVEEDGTIRSVIQGFYGPPAAASPPAPPVSNSGGAPPPETTAADGKGTPP
jgi:Tfp pilus assembly protein PilN